MAIVWHPPKHWDWCIPEDNENEIEKLWKDQ